MRSATLPPQSFYKKVKNEKEKRRRKKGFLNGRLLILKSCVIWFLAPWRAQKCICSLAKIQYFRRYIRVFVKPSSSFFCFVFHFFQKHFSYDVGLFTGFPTIPCVWGLTLKEWRKMRKGENGLHLKCNEFLDGL